MSETAPHPAAEADEAAPPYRGVVIIEWPPATGSSPYACMAGCLVKITDALTGKPVTTCTSADITVHTDAESLVTAALTLFAGEDGEPLFEGMPVLDGKEIRTGVFPFVVSEMRVRGKGE